MAALPFQAHANYGTWSIDFAVNNPLSEIQTDQSAPWDYESDDKISFYA